VPLTLPRLYAILDIDSVHARGLRPLEVLDVWLGAGVGLMQLRAKSMPLGPFTDLAQTTTERCRAAGAAMFVNDRPDVARLVGATGVHVGQSDLPPEEARKVLTAGQFVGVSTHSVAQAKEAVLAAPDYLAIGPVFATTTKANPDPVVGLEGVAAAALVCRAAGLPLVAIGGIRIGEAAEVVEAGADSVAVISDLFEGNWRERVSAWLRVLD